MQYAKTTYQLHVATQTNNMLNVGITVDNLLGTRQQRRVSSGLNVRYVGFALDLRPSPNIIHCADTGHCTADGRPDER